MKLSKLLKYGIITMFFLWWFFLSHVTFATNSFFITEDRNDNYVVRYYYPAPINIFGMYFRIIKERPHYVVLYDKDNNFIGQSSPFVIPSSIHILGSEHILPNMSIGNEQDQRFYISGEPFDGAYTIPVKEKKWWSKILQYFH
ncbi:DUF6201 family protein [Xenorhabdus sp. IM139775]|uniref:DUF6201 family protein n=1 Tax=Xenorhabdus sp. IM139775 TaxID=3025876 RepID=UPI0023595189|nr:DUF6201 family protein [Xenorhabdus sp. IM139775]MDC9594203.1 DUF6201 family protein [Xenorhabdus sp. IM139775]